MKRTLRFAAAASVMLLFVLQLSAQGPGGGRGFQMTEDDIKENAKNTAESLKLSDEQAKKVLAIDMEFYNKMQIERQKMMNAGGPPADADREAMRAKMMQMRDDRNAKYEAVLTPAQYKQFTETQEQRRNEMRQQYQQSNPDGQSEERPERGRGRG